MGEVKVAHLAVVVSGLAEEIHNTNPGDDTGGKWVMRADEAVISYEWDRTVRYWRVYQTTVTGRTVSKTPSPGVYTWGRGDAGKPDWVVLLENEYYPVRQMHKTNKVM